MAVYTKINQKEINIINKNFNIKKVINIEIILVNLILINLYICYLNKKNLDINKLYKDIYLNNELL